MVKQTDSGQIIDEPEKHIPVSGEYDLCVIGGSCTGVFAAIRAARRGLRVGIVEQANCFGGMATLSLVANWHSLHDLDFENRIIGGLINEVLERLERRDALVVRPRTRNPYFFNSEELKIELDDMLRTAGVDCHLRTGFSDVIRGNRQIKAVLVENKSGRRAIRARCFIDASGDGDLAARAGLLFDANESLQPATLVYQIQGLPPREVFNLTQAIRDHGPEFGLAKDFGWYYPHPQTDTLSLHYDTHTFGVNACDARNLGEAEMRGRRQVRAVMDLIRAHAPSGTKAVLVDLAANLGIRETRRFRCLKRLTGEEMLAGQQFSDAIANGTYPPDIHDPITGETWLKYLDGTEVFSGAGGVRQGRWRAAGTVSPAFYQIPYRSLVPLEMDNLLVAGRCIDTDDWAFGGVRVGVNCYQTGEAAGEAAALGLELADAGGSGVMLPTVEPEKLRARLASGGSIVR